VDRALAERAGAGRRRTGALSAPWSGSRPPRRPGRDDRAGVGPTVGLTRGRWAVPLAAALIAGVPARPLLAQREVVVPAGATLPIRFLQSITSGKDRQGTPVVAQAMAALAMDSCVVMPPFASAIGAVALSRGPGRGGRPGELELRFSALAIGREERIPIDAVLDSLEYALPSNVLDSGLVMGGRHARAGRGVLPLTATAVAAATSVLAVPVALLAGFELLRRGPQVRIIAGEVGRLRFLAPATVRRACTPLAEHRSLTDIPTLPQFVPQAGNRKGTRGGDPINLVLLGSGPELHAAFEAAGWQIAGRGTAKALAREITAILLGHSSYEAPVSTEYFHGRPQDATWQLQGPNARIRHHVRFWLLDSLAGVWVGAAIKDVGVLVRPLSGTATHRVDPNADAERDFTVSALEAGGCAHLLDYVPLPGAVRSGRDISRQRFVTDGRAAVVRLRRCDEATPR
jgi:hypothetical protein